MPRSRTSMRKIREVLRLSVDLGLSQRQGRTVGQAEAVDRVGLPDALACIRAELGRTWRRLTTMH